MLLRSISTLILDALGVFIVHPVAYTVSFPDSLFDFLLVSDW